MVQGRGGKAHFQVTPKFANKSRTEIFANKIERHISQKLGGKYLQKNQQEGNISKKNFGKNFSNKSRKEVFPKNKKYLQIREVFFPGG